MQTSFIICYDCRCGYNLVTDNLPTIQTVQIFKADQYGCWHSVAKSNQVHVGPYCTACIHHTWRSETDFSPLLVLSVGFSFVVCKYLTAGSSDAWLSVVTSTSLFRLWQPQLCASGSVGVGSFDLTSTTWTVALQIMKKNAWNATYRNIFADRKSTRLNSSNL